MAMVHLLCNGLSHEEYYRVGRRASCEDITSVASPWPRNIDSRSHFCGSEIGSAAVNKFLKAMLLDVSVSESSFSSHILVFKITYCSNFLTYALD